MGVEWIGLMTFGVFVIAVMYSTVGHAGASGYIAVMSLFSVAPDDLKPAALSLNILVAIIGISQFYKAGHVKWKFTWPFIVLSIPAAFLGGYINLPSTVFTMLVGLILLFSGIRFIFRTHEPDQVKAVSKTKRISSGAGIGFLAGLTGTGGGIFLSPLILLMKWAPVKVTAGTAIVFILANSIFGLAGNYTATLTLPGFILPLAGAVIAGGFVGSYLGSKKLDDIIIKRTLSIVLFIAGVKLILT